MKKCFLIAYFYPPRPDVGAQRPSKLAKYLPEFGWEPVVLTVKLPGKSQNIPRIIETDYKDVLASIKSAFGFNGEKGIQEQLNIHLTKNHNHPTFKSKIIKLAREVVAFPDDKRGWYKYAMKSACELLDKEKIDVIISTSSPTTSHLIARELKKKYHIPWIADLRDLWSQNHFNNKFSLIRHFERQLELKTFALADALVTVTPPFADRLSILHPDKTIFCIQNGFDSDDFSEAPQKLTDKFTLTYTGIFYDGKRDPSLLFEAISSLIKENKIDKNLIEVRFYGPREKWLLDAIRDNNLNGIAHCYGNVSRDEALRKQKESQLLLILLDKNGREQSVYPAKLFEYFGARRPVIAIGGDGGIVKDLLDATQSGRFAADARSLRTILYEYYLQYMTSGQVTSKNNDLIENYTYRKITERYCDLLNEIVTRINCSSSVVLQRGENKVYLESK